MITTNMSKLLLVQPYIPEYRVPLFQLLKESLAQEGIELAIAAGVARGKDSARSDDRSADRSDFILQQKSMNLGFKVVQKRDLDQALAEFRPTLVIVEQAIKNVETWGLIARWKLKGKPSVAMWGQGRSYSTSQSRIETLAKTWLTKRSDWFFAYTQGGADFMVEKGFPSSRLTVLNNSTDTANLQSDLKNISVQELNDYRTKHGLKPGRTALFLGGIDERKGIPFLLKAAHEVSAELNDFRLLVGGQGSLECEVVRSAKETKYIVYLGRVEGREKALALAAADLLVIPEWVGLVAVDSLAAQVPIVTTNHSSHSPEAEYLIHNTNSMFVEHAVSTYAKAIEDLLVGESKLRQLSVGCNSSIQSLSIELMAERFHDGVISWSNSKST